MNVAQPSASGRGRAEPVDFDGAVVIVTGGGRGIGRAEAMLMARLGARVVVADPGAGVDGGAQEEDPAGETVEFIRAAGGEAVPVRASVASSEGAREIVACAVETYGGVDAVVNNAGNFLVADFLSLTRADYQRFLDVHYFGSLEVTRAAWEHLARSGNGRVVNTISAALWGAHSLAHYGAAKGALLALTYNLAVVGMEHGIAVNAVAPGAGTRMVDATGGTLPAGTVERMKQTMPPELVAPVAAYLAHRDCAITGEVLHASGGRVTRSLTMTTQGIVDAELTVETVRDRLGEVLDLTGAVPMTTSARPVSAGTVVT